MKKGNWQTLFGAKRRAIDRALLAECERQISQADLREIELEVERGERARAKTALDNEAREAIARAFGRPLN